MFSLMRQIRPIADRVLLAYFVLGAGVAPVAWPVWELPVVRAFAEREPFTFAAVVWLISALVLIVFRAVDAVPPTPKPTEQPDGLDEAPIRTGGMLSLIRRSRMLPGAVLLALIFGLGLWWLARLAASPPLPASLQNPVGEDGTVHIRHYINPGPVGVSFTEWLTSAYPTTSAVGTVVVFGLICLTLVRLVQTPWSDTEASNTSDVPTGHLA